jgi:hypothetical protein
MGMTDVTNDNNSTCVTAVWPPHITTKQLDAEQKTNAQTKRDMGLRNEQTNKFRGPVLSPRANYTDWATATCRRNLVSTFVDREMSRGQRGGSPTVVKLSFLDRSRYFSFK